MRGMESEAQQRSTVLKHVFQLATTSGIAVNKCRLMDAFRVPNPLLVFNARILNIGGVMCEFKVLC
jgi:hypothetical protein